MVNYKHGRVRLFRADTHKAHPVQRRTPMPHQYKQKRSVLHVIGPSIAYVELTRDKFALIDSCDSGQAGKYNWSVAMDSRGMEYAVTNLPRPERGKFYLHRLLCPSGHTVDHINWRTLDNRRCNLRPATRSENSCNQRRIKVAKSGFVGVYQQRNGSWSARLKLHGKEIKLGTVSTKEEAITLRATGAAKYHGKFTPSGESK